MAEIEISRRGFFMGACTLATLGMGSVLLADDAEAARGIKRRKDGTVAVSVRKVPALSTLGSAVALGNVKGIPVAVVRTGTSMYTALDLRCPHQGAIVRTSSGGWTCPAHGSRFDTDGDVTRGPAIADLSVVKTRWIAATSTLIVG